MLYNIIIAALYLKIRKITVRDPEWPFCVKICLGNGMPWICMFWLSDKTVRKFAKLRRYCQKRRDSSFWWCFVWLFTGISWSGASNNCIQLSDLLFTEVYTIHVGLHHCCCWKSNTMFDVRRIWILVVNGLQLNAYLPRWSVSLAVAKFLEGLLFTRATLCVERVFARATCLSVCLSQPVLYQNGKS